MKAESMKTTTKAKKNVSRRGFLGTVFSASAFVLAARVLPSGLTEVALASEMNGAAWHLPIYMGLEADGTVILIAHRSEMGTGIRTALPMVAADELGADWKRVRIEQAIGDKKYGDQNTDGSKSIKDFFIPIRAEAATARMMLESAAASKWGVPASECSATNHEVVHAKSGKKIGFGELVATASQQAVPKKEDVVFKPASEYRYIGKGVPITDMDAIVTGKGVFGMDARVPGMVYASVEHPPVFGSTVKTFDDAEARKVAGVSQTLTIPPLKLPYGFQPLGGVAVIADNTWAAFQGRKKLKVQWSDSPHDSHESVSYRKALEEAAGAAGHLERNEGDVDAAFKAAKSTHEAAYYAPYLAHAPMEPVVAVAEYKDGKVTAWAPVQNPQAAQDTVAAAVGIKPADVTCNVTLLGGGFGRKSKPDFVAEAAVLSKQLGKPVKVVWTREDDIKFDYYHSVSAMYFNAALDDKGRPTAWLQRTAFPSIMAMFDPTARLGGFTLGMGFTDVPFDIPNFRAENGAAEAHVRIGWLRSVANIYHAFGVQSFADELAVKAKRDRVEYLTDLIGSDRVVETKPPQPKPFPLETARLKRVLHQVAEQSGWAKFKPSKGHALGVAVHRSFLTYVATVVEVVVDDNGKVKIPRVDTVVDAGLVVHPERAKSQFEGAAVFGTSLALFSEITAAKGSIKQSNFNDYRVARMNEAPLHVNVTILPSTAPPAGIGEPGVPTIAPAITSAIFAATGKRIRELPVKSQLA
jgi:isoquinoline 1-oxidoreductase beta subunit